MTKNNQKISLIGAGGMSLEIIAWANNIEYLYDGTAPDEIKLNKYIISNILRENNLHTIAVGYPETKEKIIKNLPIKWADPLINNLALIGKHTFIGLGSVIYPYVVINSDVEIGKIASINNNVIIGHSCKIGKMFHASAGAVVSGDVIIGDRVFIGCNACIKEKITICNDVIIGAGAVAVKDITEPGKYAGNPARKL